MHHRLNWRPDKPDHRDVKFVAPQHLKLAPLPKIVDLRLLQSPVVNQGDIGSCTGNSIAGALEFLELKELFEKDTMAPEVFGLDFERLARLFIYYNERRIEGTVDRDAGAEIRDGMKAISHFGVCRETVWPYCDENALREPCEAAYVEGKKHPVISYKRIDSTDLTQIKECLAEGFPFVMGFTVYSSFMGPEVARTGVMTMPSKSESVEGGHAVLCVGYDDAKSQVIIKNSWGASWGDKGYFYMPYEYITSDDLAADFWTVRRS